ncbi:MAG: glycoside hydrolase/phage tail family protein, partial [Hyphomicrobiales bacterium]
MATLALGAAGSALGAAALPGGVSLFGASLSGASIGMALGSTVGAVVDQALFAPSGQDRIREGSRLSDVRISASTEGAHMARVYGRVRVPGQLIWATRFEEEVIQTTQGGGGGRGGKGFGGFSGGGGGGTQPVTTTIEYRYYANIALALAEGEITRVGRIWADGKELDQSDFAIRVHTGGEDQLPDSLMEAKEGAGNAPAYRGTAYVVFERMPLARFGNRIPQLNFEVFRAVDAFEPTVKAIAVIPATGEFIYEKDEIVRDAGNGVTVTENRHSAQGGTDWTVSMDQLQSALPNVESAELFVSWFGTDLRAAHCQVRPGVELSSKTTFPDTWQVAGVARGSARLISQHEGRPAFGGTPSDASVVSAIQDMKTRGLKPVFMPFLLMDVPAGNSVPDPWTGTSGQPAYPWRGRITVDPAPGQPGSPDKTEEASAQLAGFIGTAAAEDFAVSGEGVSYSGPAEWSYRRMVLHYAHLCMAAGGVDAFVIGSELRGLTQVRDGASTYPFVAALVQLAADVKSVLGPETKVTYAADWSEYFGHQPADGSGDVHFNLDPLWASPGIDAIGIDLYWPLADWRDGDSHLDRVAGAPSIYDPGYLKGNIFGGEGYDWYYASAGDRQAQIRTPITDSEGKPWVFRFKDIRSWWSNQHYDRPGGIEAETPTAWVPESKPFWFTEAGCPAIDKGANQPNVFFDPKSAESAAPYFSRRIRDDLIQRRYLQALIEFFDPGSEDFDNGSNPVSGIYGGRMVDPARIHVYSWDARPYPAFPLALAVWSDGGNWEFGHWLNGRAAGGPLAAVVGTVLGDFGFVRYSAANLEGHLDGYIVDRIMSAREALQGLELAFFFDAVESGGLVQFRHRGRSGIAAALSAGDLADAGGANDLFTLVRGQETELPAAAKLTYVDGDSDYRQAAVESRRVGVATTRVATASLPIVMGQAQSQALAESWLQDTWAARERAVFSLPPSYLALEPSDLVTLDLGGRHAILRLTRTLEGAARSVEARGIEPAVFQPAAAPIRRSPQSRAPVFGKSVAVFMDLPLLPGSENAHTGYVAAFQSPWPGAVAFHRSPESTGFSLNTLTTAPAILGMTATSLGKGPAGRIDHRNTVRVVLDNGELQSVTQLALLGGANMAAVENSDGDWEIFQFRAAELVAPRTYELSGLLRGLGGTEGAMRESVAAGARFVLLTQAVTPVAMTTDEVGLAFNWKYGPVSREITHPSYQSVT